MGDKNKPLRKKMIKPVAEDQTTPGKPAVAILPKTTKTSRKR